MDSDLSPFEVLIKSDPPRAISRDKTYIKVVFAKLAATHQVELKHATIKDLLDELSRLRLEDVSHEEPIVDADEEMTDIASAHVPEPDAPTSNSIELIQACIVFLQTMVKVDDKVPANALDILYRCVASGIRKPARVRSVEEVIAVFCAVASDSFYAAKTDLHSTVLNLNNSTNIRVEVCHIPQPSRWTYCTFRNHRPHERSMTSSSPCKQHTRGPALAFHSTWVASPKLLPTGNVKWLLVLLLLFLMIGTL
ncbi:hypothetical protein E4T42_03332 [Aureobasidium subglaciale]|nr:hypothetical protein E4T42_03332 [Aureobasidium subglaciale]